MDAVWIGLSVAGIVALGIALWGMRGLIEGTRRGRRGVRLALAGFVFFAGFAIQLVVELVRTGDVPENLVLFAIGFVLVILGQAMFARDLRARLGRAWVLPIVAVVGLVFGLGGGENPIEEIGLFVFEGAWVALGIAILRADRRAREQLAAAAPVPA